MRSILLVATILAGTAVAGPGCHGEQELRDDCPGAGGACPACVADTDCVIVSNACHASAVCTHAGREPPLAVTQEGCSGWAAYDVPPAERCGCVATVCRSR